MVKFVVFIVTQIGHIIKLDQEQLLIKRRKPNVPLRHPNIGINIDVRSLSYCRNLNNLTLQFFFLGRVNKII